jgi:hypothetical protein
MSSGIYTYSYEDFHFFPSPQMIDLLKPNLCIFKMKADISTSDKVQWHGT